MERGCRNASRHVVMLRQHDTPKRAGAARWDRNLDQVRSQLGVGTLMRADFQGAV